MAAYRNENHIYLVLTCVKCGQCGYFFAASFCGIYLNIFLCVPCALCGYRGGGKISKEQTEPGAVAPELPLRAL